MSVPSLTPTLMLATHNDAKLREFRALLAPAGWDVIGLEDLADPPQVEETGATFAENARLKALRCSLATDLPVLADDSGLEVFALGGRPGVQSARYAGPEASDSERVRKLLLELAGMKGSREARFVCVLALAQWGSLICESEGECRGEIAWEPRGSNGFGYDPVFVVPDLGRTFAELEEDEKNRISHRARAAASLLAKLDSR